MIIGAIEAGGTKFICGLGDEKGNVLEKVSFPTTTPEETMKQVINVFCKCFCQHYAVKNDSTDYFIPDNELFNL